jgi:hypothetical protein
LSRSVFPVFWLISGCARWVFHGFFGSSKPLAGDPKVADFSEILPAGIRAFPEFLAIFRGLPRRL